eukprot:TRINITY_DN1484_c0_g1_i2.p1 TRINITY_DN1484_c0_g1~~TRINITY_DN1484_c0_g1_i2.p1  ORF type:complete len:158 (+),score=10.49 TRINITY_DN1484_c0_g1_i2:178-651(+)
MQIDCNSLVVRCPLVSNGTISNLFLNEIPITNLYLNVFGTAINDEGYQTLAQGLLRLPSLAKVILYLWKTAITDVGVSHITKSLSVLPKLLHANFHLFECITVTDVSADEFSAMIRSNPELKEITLGLRATGITTTGKETINSLKSLREFSHFDVSI